MIVRYLGMLLLSALAGILSGFLWLIPNGLMGAVLGMSLAVGAMWLGRQQQRQEGKLTRDQILLTGLACGLMGGVLMAAVSQACVKYRPTGEAAAFGPPLLPFWAPLIMGLLYGPVILGGYSARLASSNPLRTALGWTCQGSFVLKMLVTLLYACVVEKQTDPAGLVIASVALALLGAVPFALLWVLAMAWTDPAWAPPTGRSTAPESASCCRC